MASRVLINRRYASTTDTMTGSTGRISVRLRMSIGTIPKPDTACGRRNTLSQHRKWAIRIATGPKRQILDQQWQRRGKVAPTVRAEPALTGRSAEVSHRTCGHTFRSWSYKSAEKDDTGWNVIENIEILQDYDIYSFTTKILAGDVLAEMCWREGGIHITIYR